MKKKLKIAGLAVFFALGMPLVVLGQANTPAPGASKPADIKAAETAPKKLSEEQARKVWASWAHVLQAQADAQAAQQKLQQSNASHVALLQSLTKENHCSELQPQQDDSVVCVAEPEKKAEEKKK